MTNLIPSPPKPNEILKIETTFHVSSFIYLLFLNKQTDVLSSSQDIKHTS